jgi:hypothetical protein
MGGDAIEGIRRQRQMRSVEVERAPPAVVRLALARQEERQAIEQATDALGGTLALYPRGRLVRRVVG